MCEKIKNTFKPKFNPFEDEYEKYVNYYDDSCYHGDINLYEAQRSVIQAAANNLKTSNFTLISGECGSGKTVMSLGTLFTDYKRLSGSTNIVLCPTHMCIEWHNEILRFIPNSEVYYINCINDIKKLDFKIRDKFRNKHLPDFSFSRVEGFNRLPQGAIKNADGSVTWHGSRYTEKEGGGYIRESKTARKKRTSQASADKRKANEDWYNEAKNA